MAALVAIPVIAQDRPESILPPGFGEAPPPTQPPATAPPTAPVPGPESEESSSVEVSTSLTPAEEAALAPPAPQIELPAGSRRDARFAGTLDPRALGIGSRPWGAASGKSLQIVLRRMEAPIASRWLHIGLRNALLAAAPAPADVNAADWAAERAWLLLRMGEADAARLLIATVDSDQSTPKLQQIAIQTALATSDPSGMCRFEPRLSRVEPKVAPLVTAMCASLSGESERAAADIEMARRRGRLAPIDVALADKVVGAGAETARAVTVEWEPVDQLTSWRYGLATATGMMPPKRLFDQATPQIQSWLARAPMFPAADRIESARVAARLGVLSNQALVDLYAQAYDATDPDELASTDAWQLRLAYIGKELDDRMSAMRSLWTKSDSPDDRATTAVLLARAARLVTPSDDIADEGPMLVASLLAGGFDREAARWAPFIDSMDDGPADQSWAMLALGNPTVAGLTIDEGRVEDFASRDESEDKHRTALLIAGLAGLGRIDTATANRLSSEYELGLGASTTWTRMMMGAGRRRQVATVLALGATGLQGGRIDRIQPLYLFHTVLALRATGQEYLARMVAAEALART